MAFGFVPFGETISEVATLRFWRDIVIEYIATFFLLMIGTMASAPMDDVIPRDLLPKALAGGLYVYVIIETWGHIQGAAINPPVVICFMATKRLSFIKGLFYIIAELLGAASGTMFVSFCMPTGKEDMFHAFHPHPDLTWYQAGAVEFVLTLGLCCVILGALDSDHPRKKVSSPGFAISVAVAMGIIAGAPFTGGCMNPAIAFGFGILTQDWVDQPLYWAAEMAAGIVAALLYFLATIRRHTPEESFTYEEDKEKKPVQMYPLLNRDNTGKYSGNGHDC